MTLLASPPATTAQPQERSPEVRRRTGGVRATEVYAVLGAAVGSVATTAVAFDFLAPLSGPLGFVVMAYALFLGIYALLVGMDEGSLAVKDRVAQVAAHSLAATLFGCLVLVAGFTVYKGRTAITHLNLVTEDLANAGSLSPIDVGGVLHAILGTLIMISIALAIVIPLGIACAVYLNEVPGKASRLVRTVVEAMTALPSIVCGLFVLATLIQALGVPKSGFAAAMAISVMMLPIIIRASDVVLRLVPGSLKEASLALGAGRWRTAWHVTLPTSRSGLATAVILGTARGIGETSPVLLTAGYTAYTNTNPFSGPMVSLPLAVFELVKSPQPVQIARGFGAALVLLVLVLGLFVLARTLGGRPAGQLSKAQSRRRARQSASDAERLAARPSAAASLAPHRTVVLPNVMPRRVPPQDGPPHPSPPSYS
ncbi:MAG: phosphate ABC transporter permease PstA [Mycobacteriales bacterium]|nr:phosphate ABC transporter permease PstA [Mycobacteriales bacterium]